MRLVPISTQAAARRREDFLQALRPLDIAGLAAIYIIGLVLLHIQMANKLTPKQRAAIATLTILAGGAVIIIAISTRAWIVVFVAGIILGWLLSEISRL